jgi:Mrp family chromosome partitioning ATPase
MRLQNSSSFLGKVSRSNDRNSRPAEEVLATLGMREVGDASTTANDDVAEVETPAAINSIDGSRNLMPLQVHVDDAGNAETALIRRQSNSRFATQLRELVATLSANRTAQAGAHSIVLSGVGTDESSSVVAASLAVTCAVTGFQVLLVDANLSRPRLHSMFGLANGFGLSDLLGSANPPNLLPQATSIPNLAVICAGSRVSNYASLLSRQRVKHRLDPIAGAFDYIIIDASGLPPSLLAPISAGVDNVVIAVKRHVSSIRTLEATMRLLTDEGVHNSSILIIE